MHCASTFGAGGRSALGLSAHGASVNENNKDQQLTPCAGARRCRKIESRIRIRLPPSHLPWAALPQGRAPAPAAPQRSRAGLPKTCRWNRKNPSHMKNIFALAREPIFRFVVALRAFHRTSLGMPARDGRAHCCFAHGFARWCGALVMAGKPKIGKRRTKKSRCPKAMMVDWPERVSSTR